jgi:putative flippase GtrA
MKKIFEKYREIIVYLIFGVITTAVSMGVYFAILASAEHIGGISPEKSSFNAVRLVAQILQWVAGVLVAFFTNKKWVFNAGGTTKRETAQELSKFALGRVGTLGLDTVLTFGTVWLLNAMNYVPFKFILTFTADLWSKIVASIVVIISNYVISKYLVFKKK